MLQDIVTDDILDFAFQSLGIGDIIQPDCQSSRPARLDKIRIRIKAISRPASFLQ
jgi:hypothetical protein